MQKKLETNLQVQQNDEMSNEFTNTTNKDDVSSVENMQVPISSPGKKLLFSVSSILITPKRHYFAHFQFANFNFFKVSLFKLLQIVNISVLF